MFNSLSHFFGKEFNSFFWKKKVTFKKKRVQFFESYKKKSSILWVVLIKGSIRWVKRKRFNSVSHIQRKVQFWESCEKRVQFFQSYWKKVQFCGSYSRKRFNSLRHIEKRFNSSSHSWKRMETILYFRKKKSATLWDFSVDTRFNSLSHPSRKSSILRVIFEKIRAQFFESNSKNPVHFFESMQKKNQFFASYWKKTSTLLVILRSSKKRGSILWVLYKEFHPLSLFFLTQGSILWVILLEHWGSIFWVIFQKSGSIFFWVSQKKIILWVMLKRRVQYCESCWKQGFTSVSEKKGSILWVFFVSKKINSVRHVSKGLNSLSHFWRWGFFFFCEKIQFLTPTKKGSILWVIWLKKSSILWVQCKKRFNSFSQIQRCSTLWVIFREKKYSLCRIDQKRVQFESCKKVIHMKERFNSLSILKKKKVQFFESYWKTRKVQFFASYWKKTSTLWVILRRGS